MGMYTELNCAFALKKDTPDSVIAALLYMLDQRNPEPKPLPPHSLFSTERWRMLLTCSSYSFAACESQAAVWLDEADEQYHVMIRSNLKNYDGEIEKFIDWITPHIDALPRDFIGYKRYEDTEVPTLLYYPNVSITPQIPEEIFAETAWEQSAMPQPRDIVRREHEQELKGRPRNPALEKWGPELEAWIMHDLAEGKE